MRTIPHWIAGSETTGASHRYGPVYNPATGAQRACEKGKRVQALGGAKNHAVVLYFGAKVLILDEPTAALGVKQSGVVLQYIIQARERGLGVIFITHNPHHAYPVGDRFLLLNRGRSIGYFEKSQITRTSSPA
jgi:ABC-type sugar transport system ATPase subunit